MRTGGVCAEGLVEEAVVAGTAGTLGVAGTAGVVAAAGTAAALGVAGAAGATGALGAVGAEDVAAAAGFSFADSHPTNKRVASASGTVNDSCFNDFGICIRFFLIQFIMPKLLSLSLQQQEGFHGLF
jgi:hypothetical protein